MGNEQLLEQWAEHYKQSRYLRNADPISLRKRVDDLSYVLWTTDLNGAVIAASEPRRSTVLRLIHDALAEQVIRSGGHVTFSERLFREQSSQAYRTPRLVSQIRVAPTLVKFTESEFAESALKQGRLKLSPAGRYKDDPSLNLAQKDDELLHHSRTPNEQIIFKLYDAEQKEVSVTPLEMFHYVNVENYYVWCASTGYDARMFEAFTADAALIVKDRSEFVRRFSRAMAHEFPLATVRNDAVRYYDPYTVKSRDIVPMFSKNFAFWYQDEYRFTSRLDKTIRGDVFIEIGSIEDIAEIVTIQKAP